MECPREKKRLFLERLSFDTCVFVSVWLLHPLSFIGSFCIGIGATLLIFVYNPDFIVSRSNEEGMPLWCKL